MTLRSWNEIPEFMQTDKVFEYYKLLKAKSKKLVIKRFLDVILALILIVITIPIFIFLSMWIKIDSKGPIFYRQERITQYGRCFKIFKFRTMVVNADQIGELVTSLNDSRVTHVGSKIRKWRLDEVPQLFNVLFGDMSFVGTRPEVSKYVNMYSNEMKATLLLPAGITSLASIEFKSEDEIIENYLNQGEETTQIYIDRILPVKMQYNLKYIRNLSIWEDIRLCFKTIF